jgi:hypothetical protein
MGTTQDAITTKSAATVIQNFHEQGALSILGLPAVNANPHRAKRNTRGEAADIRVKVYGTPWDCPRTGG